MKSIIAIIVFFLAYTLHSITGFAGNALAFPVMSLLLGMTDAKVVMNCVAWFSAIFLFIESFKDINWKEFLKMLSIMLPSTILGIWICGILLSEEVLLMIYGIIVIVIALKNIFLKKTMNLPTVILFLVLVLAGLIQGMFLSGGAVIVIYAVQKLTDRKEFRATINMIWLVIYTYSMIDMGVRGNFSGYNIRLSLLTILPVFLSTWIGSKLVKKLDRKKFLKITYVLLLVLGISLLSRCFIDQILTVS